MHKCKCFDCGYSWFDSHQKNGHALQHTCPRCGNDKVQYMLDSLVHDLHVGLTVVDPSMLCMPYGSSNGVRFQKWMTN
jgi:predicted  nucleic acid-binding Zn-ribbon protein